MGKRTLTSIVAVGLDGAIGVSNELPWRLKSDLQFFKCTTRDNMVIMGRKTFDSIGGCLPNRENIVLSHRATLFEPHDGCVHAHSIGETLFLREKSKAKHAFVIGGALTYEQFAPFVDRYLITLVKSKFPNADAFFDQSIFGDESIWEQNEIAVERCEAADADQYDFSVFELRHKAPAEVAARRAGAVNDYRSRNPYLVRREVFRAFSSGKSLDEAISLA